MKKHLRKPKRPVIHPVKRMLLIIMLMFAVMGMRAFRLMGPLLPPNVRKQLDWKGKEKRLLRWAQKKGIIGRG
jgi:hypothetical protein